MKYKKKYIITVDIGGTKTNIGYFNNSKLIKTNSFQTKNFGPDNIDVIKKMLWSSKEEIKVICL